MVGPQPSITPGRILGVFAHPDDETFCAGGTLAKYAAQGAHTAVVSATRGEGGQIRDAAVATRATLGQVREGELLRACAELGVQDCRILDHVDGTLAGLAPGVLCTAVERLLEEFHPDVVITFGDDGAYGHPDHIAISNAVTAACAEAAGIRLYHSHFPRSRMMMVDRLARWLVELGTRFKGGTDFVHALSIFAQETTTLGYAGDFVDVVWFPPGSFIIEQGEPATSLYLIVDGEVDVVEDCTDGPSRTLRRQGSGEFIGELGVAYAQPRTANVIAVGSVTCLAFSLAEPTAFAGRGAGEPAGESVTTSEAERFTAGATTRIDVVAYVERKMAAMAAHRTQYPIDVDMFPSAMLVDMFGVEYFRRVQPRPDLEVDLFLR